MDNIEKLAIELLCGDIDLNTEDYCDGERIYAGDAVRAIIRALTPPEGYMLVPVKMTDEIGDALREAMDYGYCAESAWDLAIHAANKEVTN